LIKLSNAPDTRSDIEIIKQRKKEGLHIPLHEDVQAKTTSTYLEYIKFVHNALPELNYEDIDPSVNFLAHNFCAPIIIDSMTGGTPEASIINSRLGELAEKFGFGMGVGSQRAGLRSSDLADTYSIARKNAPKAFLMANIGGAQLAGGLTVTDAKKILEMIGADALLIHLNSLQELIQPEGEPKYKGVLQKISELVKELDVPVVVKEVGAGISREVAIRLEMAGVSGINVAGAGGTSWAGVEKLRADTLKDNIKSHLGELFWDWGIPTALSVIEVRKALPHIPLIASGGLRNGLEVAKCIVLGADMCGMAYPFLREAANSKESLFRFAELVMEELKSTMFLVGAKSIKELKNSRYLLTGLLANGAPNNR
jgi:isopentenyl-diphosphate delta-isomerase